jgi:hypothetical protein
MWGRASALRDPNVPLPTRTARDAVDHLLLGAPDLDRGLAWLEERSGIRAVPGGSHPGVGTRNALASLGRGQYVEIIAPDPAQPAYNFHVDVRSLPAPRLVTWAASTADIQAVFDALTGAGVTAAVPMDGSRERPDGTSLRWRITYASLPRAQGDADVVPFFIEWDRDALHPSSDAPRGCSLVSLELRHPEPDRVTRFLAAVGIEAVVALAPVPALVAVLDTPKGRIVI